jgi:hypothetical protein
LGFDESLSFTQSPQIQFHPKLPIHKYGGEFLIYIKMRGFVGDILGLSHPIPA